MVAPHESKSNQGRNDWIRPIYSSLRKNRGRLTGRSTSSRYECWNNRCGKSRAIYEVQNKYMAYEQPESIGLFGMEQLKELHGMVTKNIVPESGKFSIGEEGIFSG